MTLMCTKMLLLLFILQPHDGWWPFYITCAQFSYSCRENEDDGMLGSTVDNIVKSMNPVERAVLGFMCKEIIDMGRLMWMKERGLETQLVKYVPSGISPENHLLIAKCRNICAT